MGWAEPVELQGDQVVLAPLSLAHADALKAAVADGELWKLRYTSVPEPSKVEAEIERRLGLQAAGDWSPFTLFDRTAGAALGMTAYLNLVAKARRLEIGATWVRRSAQRTGANVEAKLLLLQHAFDRLDCTAVELRTNALNLQSRTAIEALGARLDGILRNHYDPLGAMRDTCVYSIIAQEWPGVRQRLQARLSRGGQQRPDQPSA